MPKKGDDVAAAQAKVGTYEKEVQSLLKEGQGILASIPKKANGQYDWDAAGEDFNRDVFIPFVRRRIKLMERYEAALRENAAALRARNKSLEKRNKRLERENKELRDDLVQPR